MSDQDAYTITMLFCAGTATIAIANNIFVRSAADSLPWYVFGAMLVVAGFCWPL